MAPEPRKLAKLDVSAGSGDPFWLQMIFEEKPAYSPCSGIPTVNWLFESAMTFCGLKPINTCIVLFAAKSNWLAAPRRPCSRSVTEPVEDSGIIAPLKTKEPFPTGVGGAVIGCGPAPLSAVSIMPVKVPEGPGDRRLVMATLRKKNRLAVIVASGVPPVQVNTMSPVLSVIPSPCTIAGIVEGTQVNVQHGQATQPAASKRDKEGKNRRNMEEPLIEVYQRAVQAKYTIR